eukprot:GHVN01011692.1.p1 GENE.GHVN01011692.1~~GHVN01011692.1.p1  ORF type:complete len:119 (+),score=27.69 GHVN01011692.1:556-912(+)
MSSPNSFATLFRFYTHTPHKYFSTHTHTHLTHISPHTHTPHTYITTHTSHIYFHTHPTHISPHTAGDFSPGLFGLLKVILPLPSSSKRRNAFLISSMGSLSAIFIFIMFKNSSYRITP